MSSVIAPPTHTSKLVLNVIAILHYLCVVQSLYHMFLVDKRRKYFCGPKQSPIFLQIGYAMHAMMVIAAIVQHSSEEWIYHQEMNDKVFQIEEYLFFLLLNAGLLFMLIGIYGYNKWWIKCLCVLTVIQSLTTLYRPILYSICFCFAIPYTVMMFHLSGTPFVAIFVFLESPALIVCQYYLKTYANQLWHLVAVIIGIMDGIVKGYALIQYKSNKIHTSKSSKNKCE